MENCIKNIDESQLACVEPLIHIIRNQQVILDSDLAMLYGVETKRLNEQVKRNIDRFPEDFMFQLTKEEAEQSRSQFATMNKRGSNIKYLPYAFTENGVAMLSSVLRSPVAIQVNIRIMRTFTSMRKVMGNAMQVVERLTRMEYRQLETDRRLDEVFRILGGKDDKAVQGLYYNGEIYDAYVFVSDLVRQAQERIILFDNYIDDTVLTILDKRAEHVKAIIYTKQISRSLQLDIARHNAQYPPIEVKEFAMPTTVFFASMMWYIISVRPLRIWVRNGLGSTAWSKRLTCCFPGCKNRLSPGTPKRFA